MAGGRALVLALLLLVPFLAIPPAAGDAPAPAPANPARIDLEPWSLGDRWTHTTKVITRSPDGTFTDTTAVVETRVVQVRAETVGGRPYTVYNATTNGTVSSQGMIPVPSVGPRPYAMTGTTSGWVWTDRSDLATVRTNQTGSASGTVSLPFPLPPAQVTVTGATTITFAPAAEDYDFPLEVGDAWRHNVTQTTTGFARVRVVSAVGTFDNTTDLGGTAASETRFWHNRTQDVAVPVGTFNGSARIEFVTAGGADGVRWFHRAAKTFVRMESHDVNGPNNYTHVWVNLTGMALVPVPWPGTIALDPQRVDPGGWVNASGAAAPNEDLRVWIPATGAAYGVRADAGGAWSVRFRAPTVDDFTPTNADVGSHGVLVEPATSPAGWDVETLQLLPPDLYVTAADLRLTPANPDLGVVTALNGTVHAGAVGASVPFNVSFKVDGVEIVRFPLPGLPAGASQSFETSWTATSGWHTVAFVADPDDEVRESDEGNNTASRTLFVAGPDLVPWDLRVEGEATATYVDPGATGFVSAPMQGRLGEAVNVTFVARNVGAANATAPFEVIVVETAGLRGPPLGPPVLRANATAPLGPGDAAGPWTASWPVPGRPGVYHLNVTVDAAGDVTEAFEGNNTFVVVVNVSGPDYRIARVVSPPRATTDANVPIVVSVRNDGQLPGDRPVALAAYEGASPTPFASPTVLPLAVGEERDVSITWRSPLAPGVPSLRFRIDAADALEEMDEGNNDATASVDVRDRPETRLAIDGPNVTAGSVFVTDATRFVLNATDRSGTGLTTWYRVGAGAIPYAAPFTLSGEGSRTIAYWSVDGLGGVEAEKSLAVVVDVTPPTVTASIGDRVGNRTVVTLTATDAGVGVAFTEVRVDNGTWRRYDGPFSVEGFGPHRVEFRATDRLGNEGPVQSLPWTIREPSVAGLNVKPFLAVAFAAILLALGLTLHRRQVVGGRASPRTLGVLFAAAEIATGVASVFVAALAVPPYGFGLVVDLVIFGGGVALLLAVHRRGASGVTPSPEGEADQGRDPEEQERDPDV